MTLGLGLLKASGDRVFQEASVRGVTGEDHETKTS